MDLQPFFIEYDFSGKHMISEVKPCCQQDHVVFYDIWTNNSFQFTITTNNNPSDYYTWRLALANSDKKIDAKLVEVIGQHIDKYLD